MANFNFIDFYIVYPGHPRFKQSEIIEDEVVRVIVQKYEMIIFTNKGELLGDPNFGANLTALLHETRVSAEAVEADIRAQISDYISELDNVEYDVIVEFFEDPERHQEYMVIDFFLNGIEVNVTVT
jgi:hypothetical protein